MRVEKTQREEENLASFGFQELDNLADAVLVVFQHGSPYVSASDEERKKRERGLHASMSHGAYGTID